MGCPHTTQLLFPSGKKSSILVKLGLDFTTNHCDIRYQLIFREIYVKDETYEFLILSTVNVFKIDININSQSDIEKVSNIFLKTSSQSEIDNFGRNIELYCLIKEDNIWKACSYSAFVDYLKEKGYLPKIKAKSTSNKSYDVVSTVENGIRTYQQIN